MTSRTLTTLEKEVLSRGLKFGIPQKTTKEDILAEFEVMYRQLRYHEPISNDALDTCRVRLTNAANNFNKARNDCQGFSLKAEHFKVMKGLRNNDDTVILINARQRTGSCTYGS